MLVLMPPNTQSLTDCEQLSDSLASFAISATGRLNALVPPYQCRQLSDGRTGYEVQVGRHGHAWRQPVPFILCFGTSQGYSLTPTFAPYDHLPTR